MTSLEERIIDDNFERQKQFYREKELKKFRHIVKRSRFVQELFDLPHTDFWIKDFSCAIERGILRHGRMYITRYHLCFYANILGIVTKEKVLWSSVKAIEKDTHGLINPSLIVYSSQEKENKKSQYNRQFFASFGSRDKSFKRLIKTWQTAPNITDKNGISLSTFLCNSNLKKNNISPQSSSDTILPLKSASITGGFNSHTNTSNSNPNVNVNLSSSHRSSHTNGNNSTNEKSFLSSLSNSRIGQSGILGRLNKTHTDTKKGSSTSNTTVSFDAAHHTHSGAMTSRTSRDRGTSIAYPNTITANPSSESSEKIKLARNASDNAIEEFENGSRVAMEAPKKSMLPLTKSKSESAKLIDGARIASRSASAEKSEPKEREIQFDIKPSIWLYFVLVFILFGALLVWILLVERQIAAIQESVAFSRQLVANGLLELHK